MVERAAPRGAETPFSDPFNEAPIRARVFLQDLDTSKNLCTVMVVQTMSTCAA